MPEKQGFFVSGGRSAWLLLGAVILVAIASAMLFSSTVNARY